jgi:hypothetical protein
LIGNLTTDDSPTAQAAAALDKGADPMTRLAIRNRMSTRT